MDVPYLFNLKWSINSRLKDAIQQFHKHLDKLQDFWNLMDDIDHSLLVSDLRYPQRALSHRQLNISNDSYIILSIDANDPTSLPEGGEIEGDVEEKLQKMEKGFRDCGLVGKDGFKFLFRKVEEVLLAIMSLGDLSLKMTESFLRMRDKPFSENLAHVLDIQLHGPSSIQKTDPQTECGICYAQYLPIDDELGDKSGSGTDCTCENNSCSRAFHSVCLGDWLRSITTTRQ
uniref:Ubiquitin ligase protein FANCL n=1 Tax=Solanum tuberosum TaxID=4113 RepID=M1BFK0_SOLTU